LTQNSEPSDSQARAVCDYEGSSYEQDFWIGQGRDYEDRVERIALRRLLPPQGDTLVDIGAGFGRLADLYAGYERVILVDYSRTLLQKAQTRLGRAGTRFLYVAANVYSLPFADAVVDTAVMVRVIHHLADVPAALGEIARLIRPQGSLILEFANKRNLKAIGRYALRRQSWSPFAAEPIEFVPLNYNFHPHWIEQTLRRVGLAPQRQLSVSHFRMRALKRTVPLGVLTRLDSALQPSGKWWQLSPSTFVQVRQTIQAGPTSGALFRCPACHSEDLQAQGERLACAQCNRQWRVVDGLYDFKEPV
jgi:ubiquinone/menaquinone biosynthesis C-methylase UbiE